MPFMSDSRPKQRNQLNLRLDDDLQTIFDNAKRRLPSINISGLAKEALVAGLAVVLPKYGLSLTELREGKRNADTNKTAPHRTKAA